MLFSWQSPPLTVESSLQTTPHSPKRLDPDHSSPPRRGSLSAVILMKFLKFERRRKVR